MGTRIGALWRKERDGKAYLTGNIGTEAGICIPAHVKVQVSLRANEDKKSEKAPDFFIEAWEGDKTTGSGGGGDSPV